jgi:hypothetical protein
MQSNAQKLWIPSPSGSTLTTDINFPGEVRIVDQMSILASSVSRCQKVCASPCEENIWTIEFGDVDFGDCNACGKSVGFTLLLNRNPDFDNQTYFEYNQRKQYVYQGPLDAPSTTGAALAQWFYLYITDLQNQNDQHDQFLVEASVASNVLTLKFPCSGLIAYSLIGIYQLPNNNLATLELPVFIETQDAVEAVLSREKLLQQFPQEIGHVFGEAPRDQWMWCQTICVITLKGCIDACSSFFDNQNSGHLHTGATPFDLMLYVNSAAPGFAAFIADLNLLFPLSCGASGGLNTAPGLQAGVQAPYVAGGTVIDISSLEFDAINGTPYVVSSGPVRSVVIANSPTDLAVQINNIFGAGNATYSVPNQEITFVAAAPGIVVNAFAAPAGFISIVPESYQNYVGE